MARGWESKSVDEQIADKLARREPDRNLQTPSQQARESLLLQRKRILTAIEASVNPRYIAQQEQALAFLDRKLEQLID
ncbi:MAG: hypothetical protein M3Z09_11650 [Acidobacteriota bacterium]|nr:hypothetical protein [Acidobacteriota bacterium]